MTLLERLRQQQAQQRSRLAELRNITDRDLDSSELVEVDTLLRELPPLDERITQLAEEQARAERLAASQQQAQRAAGGEPAPERAGGTTVTEPDIYRAGGPHSYFRDLARSQVFGDRDATDRLVRSAAVHQEQRALGNTNTTGGSGGEFAPPQWLVDQYVALVRAGRVTADLLNRQEVPLGVSSINLPRVLSGTSVAVQSTQNSALANVDMTTGSVGTGFTTLGGRQIVSQQILDQTAIDFDKVVLADLASAYAAQVGAQVFLGAGAGANNNSVINGINAATLAAGNAVTYTSATPTAATFYSKAAGAMATFVANRLVAPTAWVMHPRRWYWLLAQTDGQGRPLVVPIANAALTGPSIVSQNAMADGGAPQATGLVGLFLGLPVYIDPAVPTNLGAGTNQDRVYLLKADDLFLFESAPRAEVFRETYADSLGVLFRLYSYVGTILNRLPSSIAWIDGTGLTTPTF